VTPLSLCECSVKSSLAIEDNNYTTPEVWIRSNCVSRSAFLGKQQILKHRDGDRDAPAAVRSIDRHCDRRRLRKSFQCRPLAASVSLSLTGTVQRPKLTCRLRRFLDPTRCQAPQSNLMKDWGSSPGRYHVHHHRRKKSGSAFHVFPRKFPG
jgi:hypothetical protein